MAFAICEASGAALLAWPGEGVRLAAELNQVVIAGAAGTGDPSSGEVECGVLFGRYSQGESAEGAGASADGAAGHHDAHHLDCAKGRSVSLLLVAAGIAMPVRAKWGAVEPPITLCFLTGRVCVDG